MTDVRRAKARTRGTSIRHRTMLQSKNKGNHSRRGSTQRKKNQIKVRRKENRKVLNRDEIRPKKQTRHSMKRTTKRRPKELADIRMAKTQAEGHLNAKRTVG